jgi:uncharacterized membrane protein
MASRPSTGSRLGYLDWARGLVVVLMIHTHGFFAWVAPAFQDSWIYRKTVLAGGYPAAIFLFLSGLVLALGNESRSRRGAPGRERVREGVKRGLEVLGYAFLFRLWMLAASFFWRPADFLRVDVLNCIGGSLVLVSLASFGARSPRARALAALALAAAMSLLAPLAWDGPWLRGLPEPILGYFSGRPPDARFPLLPWAGFAAAGAAAGVLLDAARQKALEGRGIAFLPLAGALAVGAGVLVDRFGPRIYPREDYWFTSPSYFLVKGGIVLLALGFAYVASRIPGPSPLRQLGRTSLLVYWVHLEIIYGMFVIPWARQSLDVPQALVGVALLTLAMLGLSYLRTDVLPRWWQARRPVRAG